MKEPLADLPPLATESGESPDGAAGTMPRVPRQPKHLLGYLGLTGIFFLVSILAIYAVHRQFSEGGLRLVPGLLSFRTVGSVVVLLCVYYLSDGLRLYHVIRAMGYHVPFRSLIKLVFVNILISNITPLATGGGVAQVYFLHRKGMPVGDGTAATTIRTILAASILFTLTPMIIIAEPNLFSIFRRGRILLYVSAFCAFYFITFLTIWLRTRWVKAGIYRVMLLSCRTGILSPERFRRWYRRISREIRRFVYGFGRFTGGPALHVSLSVLFTVVFLLALFSFSVVLIRALGYSVPTWSILAFQVVVTFFMYFAPTPGAAGVAEGGYGLLFATLLQKRDLAMLTLLWRFLTIYIGVLAGLLIIYREMFARGKAVEP